MGDVVLARPKRQGNYKAGPGRPKGSKNKSTIAIEAEARKAAAKIDQAFEGDAHDFLMAVYKNPAIPLDVRIVAASRALRVEKPLLSMPQIPLQIQLGIGERLKAAQKKICEKAKAESV